MLGEKRRQWRVESALAFIVWREEERRNVGVGVGSGEGADLEPG